MDEPSVSPTSTPTTSTPTTVPTIEPTISPSETSVPSVFPTSENTLVTITASLIFRLVNVPGPLTDEKSDAFFAACIEFYDRYLPNSASDISCTRSARRLLAEQYHGPHQSRQLQRTIDIPVDVTATFVNIGAAAAFDNLVVILANALSPQFEAILQSTGSVAVQTYFRSVTIQAFAPVQPPSGMGMGMGMGMMGGMMGMNMNIGKGMRMGMMGMRMSTNPDVAPPTFPAPKNKVPSSKSPNKVPKPVSTPVNVPTPVVTKTMTGMGMTGMSLSGDITKTKSTVGIRLKQFLHQLDP
jgi:hypothetical protein